MEARKIEQAAKAMFAWESSITLWEQLAESQREYWRNLARAASAVDQGLRKAAQDFVNKLEMVEPAINGAFAFQAIHGANYDGPNYGEELNALKAALTRQDGPVIGDEPLTSEFLIPEFLAAVNDIGRYGLEKYGEQSFQARRLKGDVSRGTLSRCHTSEIGDHIREHYRQYMAQIPHDHFKDEAHQLAAIAFNAMMEFWFAGFAAPRPEPSQPVNYVSAPHDAKTMRCQSCGSDQWPQCPSCGALLIEKPESTQETHLRVDNTDAYEERLDAERSKVSQPMSGTMQDEVRVTDRAQEPLSQQEVEPFGDNESSRFVAGMKGASARAAGFPKDTQHGYAGRNADQWVDGWEYCDDCLRDPNFKPAPSSVQPSTEDVVAQMVAVAETAGQHHSNPLMILRCQMHAALPVARAGWHPWESVEKAIRAEFVHQFKSSYAHELGGILYGVQRLLSQQDAKAEPAERVTVLPYSVGDSFMGWIVQKDRTTVTEVLRENTAKWVAAGLRAELDAQGGNKA